MALKRFNANHQEQALALLREGTPVRDVAKTFGVHISTLYDLRKAHGLGPTKSGRASHVITLRLTEEELQALSAFETAAGFTDRSAAMRSLIRAATGFLELKRSEYLGLAALNAEIKAQGRNLNQMARALNRSAVAGGAQIGDAEREVLQAAREGFAAVNKTVSTALRDVKQKGRAALHSGDLR